jgi:nucleoside-diphosphate-sugar epimerase
MIAVTGANGLLGSYIIRNLFKSNTPFVALKRRDSDTALLDDLKEKIIWRDVDITNPISLEEGFADVTGVIHTAAYVSFNPQKAKTIFQINTEGTRNIVNACLLKGIKRLLHVSSVAALGRQKGQTIINEENKWVESSINSFYGQSKYQAELEVFRGQEEGLSTLIVNPSVILGFSNWDKSSAQLFKYAWKERPFYINGSLNYVDAQDVADASIKLFDSPISGERFILSGGSIPFKTFFDKTANAFQRKSPQINVNPTVANLLAAVEGARTWFTGSEPLITRETARLVNTFFQYDNQKVKKAINFNFQSIDSTLQRCCEHYKRKYEIKNQ